MRNSVIFRLYMKHDELQQTLFGVRDIKGYEEEEPNESMDAQSQWPPPLLSEYRHPYMANFSG